MRNPADNILRISQGKSVTRYIYTILRLSSEKIHACADVDRIAAEHRNAVEEKLDDLKRLLNELERISACCRGKSIIKAVASSKPCRLQREFPEPAADARLTSPSVDTSRLGAQLGRPVGILCKP